MADESTDAVPCVANPDVAGIGVMYSIRSSLKVEAESRQILFSLVASAMLTFFISLACALLKHFSPPLDAAALDQELLHRMDRTPSGLVIYSLLALGFKGRPVLFSKNPGNAVYMWHYISSELALSLGFNQIITGLALLICTLAKYNISSRDPHVSLARTLSLLSVASQALVGFNVQISQGTTSGIRGWLSVLYIYTFIIVNAIGFKKTHDVANLIGAVLLGFVISWPGLFDLVALMKEGSNSDSDEVPSRRTTRNRNFAFASSLIVEAVFVTYYTVRVFQLKYDSDTTGGCDLNTAEVNQWTLGQILALIMLVAPFLSARETYRSTYTTCSALA